MVYGMVSDFTPKIIKKFICENCQFVCSKQSDYDRHISTRKHTTVFNGTNNTPLHKCVCGNEYKHKSGLYRHKRVCDKIDNSERVTGTAIVQPTQTVDTTVVIELLKQNQEFKDLMVEQSKQLMDQQQQLFEQQQQNHNIRSG